MSTGVIFDIKEISLFDGDGVNITVFLKGCPMHCLWCHNPEGIAPERKLYGTKVIGERLTAVELAQRLNNYAELQELTQGYIIFSGGEPLLQTDFLIETIEKLQYRKIIIDTSGYAAIEDIAKITPFVSRYYFDLKIMDANLHRNYTGCSNASILQNLFWLDACHDDIVIRCPLIPGITDTEKNLDQLADIIRRCRHVTKVEFLMSNPFLASKYKSLNIELSGEVFAFKPRKISLSRFDWIPMEILYVF